LSCHRNKITLMSFVLSLLCIFISGGMAAADTVDELIKKLQTGDEETRMKAVKEMAGIKDEKIIEPLSDSIFMRGEDWYIKIRAIRILGEIETPRVQEVLLTVFNDPFLNNECPAIKWNTTMALGRKYYKGTRVVDALISALEEDNLLLREGLIQTLGKIGDAKAVPYLIPQLNDKSFAIKFSAIKALERIGDPQAIHSLKKISDTDGDPFISREAGSAINNIRLSQSGQGG
jgi:HEAT repeat protein